jgi:hypothetical protein
MLSRAVFMPARAVPCLLRQGHSQSGEVPARNERGAQAAGPTTREWRRRHSHHRSTGLSFDRASQRYEEKCVKKVARTPWRKMHLAIDPDMKIHAIEITGTDVSDSEGLDRILPTELLIDQVIADGAYYSIERGEALNDRGIVAVIRRPRTLLCMAVKTRKLRDQTVQYILDKGSIYAFHKNTATDCAHWLKRRSRASSDVSAQNC